MIISLTLELVLCWRHRRVMSPLKAAPPPSSSVMAGGLMIARGTPYRAPEVCSHSEDVVTSDVLAATGGAVQRVWLWRGLMGTGAAPDVPNNPVNICCSPIMHCSIWKERDWGWAEVWAARWQESRTHSGLNTLCVCVCAWVCMCDGGSKAHFLSAADCDSDSPAAANGTVRKQTSVLVNGGRRRPRWAETEVLWGRTSQSVDGNALLIPLQRLPLDAIQQRRARGGISHHGANETFQMSKWHKGLGCY